MCVPRGHGRHGTKARDGKPITEDFMEAGMNVHCTFTWVCLATKTTLLICSSAGTKVYMQLLFILYIFPITFSPLPFYHDKAFLSFYFTDYSTNVKHFFRIYCTFTKLFLKYPAYFEILLFYVYAYFMYTALFYACFCI